jgi:predicted ATPase
MALVARVALAPQRDHAREELVALLWPEADAVAGRNRLRQTLSLLKAVLEPAGSPPVLLADRRVVRAAPGALWCDAVAFEAAMRAGQLEAAQALYMGALMPGFYDEWLLDERQRFASLADRLGGGLFGVPSPPGLPGHPGLPSVPDQDGARAQGAAPVPSPAATAAPAAPGTRLPQYLTRLVGADLQGARLRAAVSEHRWVTVLGPGGSGKTRLAVEVARLLCEASSSAGTGAGTGTGTGTDTGTRRSAGPRAHQPRFERALFVSLVGAVSRNDVLDRLALALRLGASGDASEAVMEVLDQRAVLVLVDNTEELDDGAVAVLAHLAERLPQAHWLATSRRPLGHDGERSFPLEALELPDPAAPLPQVVINPAVALFVDRARAHRADFHVNASQQAAVVALVHWLEGLPLAIELAASHARTLSPAELLSLLQAARQQHTSLAYLARRGTRSGSDPRHASMLDVVGWSWRLLGAELQQLLLALCVLPGGATVHTAAALLTEPGQPADLAAAHALLDELVDHSVVRASPGQDGQWRYHALEPVREFGLGQHDDAAQRPWRQRALRHFLAWALALPATPPLPLVRDEMPNLMHLLAAAPGDADAATALELVLHLQSAWGEIAVPDGVLQALDLLLQVPRLDDSSAAGGHALAAGLCQESGRQDDARRHMAAALARPCPKPGLRAMVLSRVARMCWRVDRDHERARALIEEALPLARASQRTNTEASLLSLKGHLCSTVDGDAQQGKAYSAQALALWARSGNRHLINAGRYNVAVQTSEAGRPADVLEEFAALEAEGRELQDWDLAAGALEARGTALLKLRRWPEAADSLRAATQVAWQGMEIQATVYALWCLAPALARLRLGRLAAETMGAAEAQWLQRMGKLGSSDLRDIRRLRRFARVLLGPEAAAAAWREGATRSLGQAVQRVAQAVLVPPSV